ncbi:MAG: M48 family metallopeptidase, partial [Gammaproteobacteria bacterium]
MHSFTILFLAMLALSVLIRTWLSQRQISHIMAHRASVPGAFEGKISLDEHQKAADYTVTKTRFGRLPMLYDAGLLLIWTLGGGLDWLDQTVTTWGFSPIMTGIIVIIAFMLIASLLELPFSIYTTFVIEERFGFNRTTVKTFIIDMIKGGALALVLGVPLLWIILWLMEKSGELWWIYAWAVWTSFSLFIMWVYPTLIAPVFNKFEPLEEGKTLERIKQLLHRCGFSSNGI